MRQAFVGTGSIQDSRTVRPDEPIPLSVSGGKARLIAEVVGAASKMSHDDLLAWLRERPKARGHVPPC